MCVYFFINVSAHDETRAQSRNKYETLQRTSHPYSFAMQTCIPRAAADCRRTFFTFFLSLSTFPAP